MGEMNGTGYENDGAERLLTFPCDFWHKMSGSKRAPEAMK
jgi:hypothetical protein